MVCGRHAVVAFADKASVNGALILHTAPCKSLKGFAHRLSLATSRKGHVVCVPPAYQQCDVQDFQLVPDPSPPSALAELQPVEAPCWPPLVIGPRAHTIDQS